jgi:hypothetical protein
MQIGVVDQFNSALGTTVNDIDGGVTARFRIDLPIEPLSFSLLRCEKLRIC